MVSSLNSSVDAWKHPLFLLAMSFICALVSGSFIKVENGAYKGITVRVNDDVSSCHCDQVIENLQVRLKHQQLFSSIIFFLMITFSSEVLSFKNSHRDLLWPVW